jgi:plasmid stabilization system protein ParE
MPAYRIRYTIRASRNQEDLYEYLLWKWGINTVKKLDEKIEKILKSIAEQPEMFPASNQRTSIRRCVITKQTILFYRISSFDIELLAFFDTRQNPRKTQLK